MQTLFNELKNNFFSDGKFPKYTLIVEHSEEFDILLTGGKFQFKKVLDGLYYLTTTYNCECISNYLIDLLNTKIFVLSEITGNNICKFVTENEKIHN